MYMCHGFESHLRQLICSRKSDCLGCAVLLCLVCLFDLACFFLSSFLPSHLSFKNMYNGIYNVMYTCSTTQRQMTALHYSSEKGHHESVQLLLEKGADPNVQDKVSVLLSSLYLQYIPQHVMCVDYVYARSDLNA